MRGENVMKVLKQENGKERWETISICNGKNNPYSELACGSMLLVDEDDVFVTLGEDQRTKEMGYFYTFLCPVCGCMTDIAASHIPHRVKNEKIQEYDGDKNKYETDKNFKTTWKLKKEHANIIREKNKAKKDVSNQKTIKLNIKR